MSVTYLNNFTPSEPKKWGRIEYESKLWRLSKRSALKYVPLVWVGGILEYIGRCLIGPIYNPIRNCLYIKPAYEREHRLILSEAAIEDKLKKQNLYNSDQMRSQADHPKFQYKEKNALKEEDENFGVSWAKGKRDTMQDAHRYEEFSIQIKEKETPVKLFGVFDGHGTGGEKVSQHVSDQIKKSFIQIINDLQQIYPELSQKVLLWNALKIVFVHMTDCTDFQIGGTTAALALVVGTGDSVELWTANVGDSRVILENDGEAMQLTEDAKPDDARYKQNIEDRGGIVEGGRICGVRRNLGVGRAVGDKVIPGVSARSKVSMVPMKKVRPDSHLILVCDGVSDNASTKQIVQVVAKYKKTRTCQQLAQDLVCSSLKVSSHDNNTVMVAKIKRA